MIRGGSEPRRNKRKTRSKKIDDRRSLDVPHATRQVAMDSLTKIVSGSGDYLFRCPLLASWLSSSEERVDVEAAAIAGQVGIVGGWDDGDAFGCTPEKIAQIVRLWNS